MKMGMKVGMTGCHWIIDRDKFLKWFHDNRPKDETPKAEIREVLVYPDGLSPDKLHKEHDETYLLCREDDTEVAVTHQLVHNIIAALRKAKPRRLLDHR